MAAVFLGGFGPHLHIPRSGVANDLLLHPSRLGLAGASGALLAGHVGVQGAAGWEIEALAATGRRTGDWGTRVIGRVRNTLTS